MNTSAPNDLRRRHIRLDNIALLPGDMLPFMATWEKIAGNLPAGSSLIVLPPSSGMITAETMGAMLDSIRAALPGSDPVVVRDGEQLAVALTVLNTERRLDSFMEAMGVVSQAHEAVFGFQHGDAIMLGRCEQKGCWV